MEGPIRVALNVEDKGLANRLTVLLTNIPGLRLVRANECPDVVLVLSTEVSTPADGDVPLTPRELEVLTLLAEGKSKLLVPLVYPSIRPSSTSAL